MNICPEHLRIEHIYKSYPFQSGAQKRLAILEDISLEVADGEFVSLIGPSGCGKSTLFNLVSGLEEPDRGNMFLKGREITGERGHVGYMMQKDLLLPWRNVLDNCILAMEIQQIPRKKATLSALAMLEEMGLAEYAHHYPGQLSGGMRQRVSFVRTMLAGREILLLDEPFGALDAFTKSEMHEWLAGSFSKYRPTVLFITHDIEEALLLSDRIYVLSARPSKIKQQIKVEERLPRSREVLTQEKFIAFKKILLKELFSK
ncbi:MAG: ABC transporter ATP-binding protein [Clostridia bacterium]|jgi:ABC-type nitrate/sulfonate/bicarbonate transport system ATPase subunit|nr:ABC transporter ATP-binding protein [Clostridia bacterium]